MRGIIAEYYMRKDVQEAIVDFCRNREVSVATFKGGHMKRPMILQYPKDVEELVKDGGVSFHCSVERWKNPMMIRTGMEIDDMNNLRSGWDLIIDIDSMMGMQAAKLAARRVIDFLKEFGITPSIKFSGNRGFHIGVGWDSFSEVNIGEDVSDQFPKVPAIIISYIKNKIKHDLINDLIEMEGGKENLVREFENSKEFASNSSYVSLDDPYIFVDIESNWSNRHLFRAPYSINEKSNMVSIPIEIDQLEKFDTEMAKPFRVRTKLKFLQYSSGSARNLMESAKSYWSVEVEKKEFKKTGKKIKMTGKIPESRFPPCMKTILAGITDGKKRAILILANFLRSMNWTDEEIRDRIIEWNQKNSPPLPDSYINMQLTWFERQDKMLPPNCDNEQFMLGIGVCNPDSICKQGTNEIQIKNPAVYPFKKRVKEPNK